MVDWVFIALIFAAIIHVTEEYVFPGGFKNALSNLLPKSSHLFTHRFHIIINGLLILICVISAIIGKANLILSLSAFSLVLFNGILHIRGSIINKGYYPGVISSVLIYFPLTIYAYWKFISEGQLTLYEGILSVLLGITYMAILMIYVLYSARKSKSMR
jgi:hypothetical protein